MSGINLGSEVSRPKIILEIERIGVAEGEFHRFASPRTVDALLRALPVGGRAAIWGEEVYFQVSVQAAGESPRNKLEVGSIAYWPMGSAVCVFFGPTKPYSPVNMIGRVTANLELFRKVRGGTTVTIKKA